MTWPIVRLGDVSGISAGNSAPQGIDDFSSDGTPFIRAGSLVGLLEGSTRHLERVAVHDAKRLKLRHFPKDTILFAKSGMSCLKGYVYRLPFEAHVVSHLAAVLPGPDLDPAYAEHALRVFSPISLVKDASYPSIRLPEIADLEIPLPPLEEQKRIAAILDQADALRRLRARALTRLNALGQAIFHEMFGRKETSPLKSIAEFADVKGGKRLPKGSDYSDDVTPHPYIRVSDLGDLKIDTSVIKYISPEIQKSVSRYTVSHGDVVISIAGSIGLTAAVPERLNGANLTENAAKITPKNGAEFDPTYLSWALSMPEAKAQILASTGQVTIGKLALFRIEQIEVPMPTIERQRAFAAALREVASEGDTVLKGSAAFETLFTSLQHRAFRGEL